MLVVLGRLMSTGMTKEGVLGVWLGVLPSPGTSFWRLWCLVGLAVGLLQLFREAGFFEVSRPCLAPTRCTSARVRNKN